MPKKTFALILFIFAWCPIIVGAQGTSTQLKIFSGSGELKASFDILPESYQGNIDLSAADLGGDGTNEILIGYGGGNQPRVEAWRGSGSKIYDFLAYGKNFQGGINVSAGDINSDRKDEIITASGYLSRGQIRAFADKKSVLNYFVYNNSVNQGARVLAADLGGDGKSEIIVASNFNQRPKLLLFGNTGHKIKEVKLDYFNNNGLEINKFDIENDGKHEILVAGGKGNMPNVLVLDSKLNKLMQFTADDNNYLGGLNVAGGDVNGDGKSEIIVSRSFGGDGRISLFDLNGKEIKEFYAYDGWFSAGVKLAVADVDGDKQLEIITLPERFGEKSKSDAYKSIYVDLSKQRLYFYQSGHQLGSFLISSGVKRSPTPEGEFAIYLKRPKVRMSWYYGPGSPLNYDLPNVPWVASFKGPYTIHGTYWHHNFGHPMSHGCVNMYTPDAKLIYDWAETGTPVIIF